MSIIILDIDNCIADDSWRIPQIRWEVEDPFFRYHDYHSLGAFDMAHNHDLYVNNRMDIVILTARPIIYRAATEEWLKRHGVGYEVLMMRDMDDHDPSVKLKQKQLQALFDTQGVKPEHIAAAYDDRPEIVAMYAILGIPSEVRAIHNVCAYTNPLKDKRNANRRFGNGKDAGNLQGARQGVQSELPDDRGSSGGDVSGGHNAQDAGGPQQVAPVPADDDQSYPTR